MRINKSNAIVGIGQKVKKASIETGDDYLELNRGVNSVTNINLSNVIKDINPNSLDKFSGKEKEKWSKYSRICVSVPNNEFVKFVSKII